ncbi:MAG: MBL fold metallo-hydrolase [Deltaproteobacteria bacterium]|nr:MBL fold metallo-hydrolase [Deltaproteobacteria bacterium]
MAIGLVIAATLGWRHLHPPARPVPQTKTLPPPGALASHCQDAIGEPRVEEIVDGVWVALAYDLANTILVRTTAGNVIIDPGMSPKRSAVTRAALLAKAPGPTLAIIYTHSHIDHVGGASAWADDGTPIWATEGFVAHFLKQYSRFRPAEARRGARQFGLHVDDATLPCSALGRRIDLIAAAETGVLMPTKTFTGRTSFVVGGVTFELEEAHGETHDHLLVWLPQSRVLLPGDNYYRAFPNLYTIRGSAPRPVDAWIDSLDRMRRLQPEHLVPSHTAPLHGASEIQTRLTRYRDGIQWVRDRVVRAGNAGASLDEVAEDSGLPPALADEPALQQLYGQLDWSARAIYVNHLGWFDGRAETLYPMPKAAVAERTIRLMGGVERVWQEIDATLPGEPRWALHLLALLRDAGAVPGEPGSRWATAAAKAMEAIAATVSNSNGRGYLAERAHELRHGMQALPQPRPTMALLQAIPTQAMFDTLETRLIPERSQGIHETVHFVFPDTKERYVVTIRNGIAETVAGQPLPATPEPLATVQCTSTLWRQLAAQLVEPAQAVANGDLEVSGSVTGFYTFMQRFADGI